MADQIAAMEALDRLEAWLLQFDLWINIIDPATQGPRLYPLTGLLENIDAIRAALTPPRTESNSDVT